MTKITDNGAHRTRKVDCRFPEGLEDVSKFPNVIAALIDDPTFDWTDEDLGKLTSENILRVFDDARRVSDALKFRGPQEQWISEEDLGEQQCSTLYN